MNKYEITKDTLESAIRIIMDSLSTFPNVDVVRILLKESYSDMYGCRENRSRYEAEFYTDCVRRRASRYMPYYALKNIWSTNFADKVEIALFEFVKSTYVKSTIDEGDEERECFTFDGLMFGIDGDVDITFTLYKD